MTVVEWWLQLSGVSFDSPGHRGGLRNRFERRDAAQTKQPPDTLMSFLPPSRQNYEILLFILIFTDTLHDIIFGKHSILFYKLFIRIVM